MNYRLGCLLPGLLVIVAAATIACSSPGSGQDLIETATVEPSVPIETPLITPVPLAISKTSLTANVSRGGTASVTIQTVAGALCSIDVEYDSGSSTAKGLDAKTASSSGAVKWSWTVGRNTDLGAVPIYVACSKGSRDGTIDLEFTVKK